MAGTLYLISLFFQCFSKHEAETLCKLCHLKLALKKNQQWFPLLLRMWSSRTQQQALACFHRWKNVIAENDQVPTIITMHIRLKWKKKCIFPNSVSGLPQSFLSDFRLLLLWFWICNTGFTGSCLKSTSPPLAVFLLCSLNEALPLNAYTLCTWWPSCSVHVLCDGCFPSLSCTSSRPAALEHISSLDLKSPTCGSFSSRSLLFLLFCVSVFFRHPIDVLSHHANRPGIVSWSCSRKKTKR